MKRDIRDRFGPKHALKSPPHITLQMPFKMMESEEGKANEALSAYAETQEKFKVVLDGFGHFDERVVFLSVQDHSKINRLHQKLKPTLLKLGIPIDSIKDTIHSHMTLATRDVSVDQFHLIWNHCSNRQFFEIFDASEVCLLKHNGKHWDVLQHFPFALNA